MRVTIGMMYGIALAVFTFMLLGIDGQALTLATGACEIAQ